MEINETTRLKDILSEYPWLPEELMKIDKRFGIINNPVGKLLIRTATLGDASKKAGYPAQTVVDELNKLIEKHGN